MVNRALLILLCLIYLGTSIAVHAEETEQVTPQQLAETYQRALQLFDKNQYQDSLAEIRQVIKSNMSNYKLRYLAAHNHWRLRNYEAAAIHFSYCVQAKPDDPSAAIDLALMQLEQNQTGKARKTLETAILNLTQRGKSASAKIYNILARIDLQNFNPQGALKNSEKAKAAYEKNKAGIKDQLESILLEGRAYLLQNKFDQAELSLLWGLSLQPNDATILNLIGYSYEQWYLFLRRQTWGKNQQKEKIAKAAEFYEKSLQSPNTTESFRKTVESNLARVRKYPLPDNP